jgi:hypothetical protein
MRSHRIPTIKTLGEGKHKDPPTVYWEEIPFYAAPGLPPVVVTITDAPDDTDVIEP